MGKSRSASIMSTDESIFATIGSGASCWCRRGQFPLAISNYSLFRALQRWRRPSAVEHLGAYNRVVMFSAPLLRDEDRGLR